MNASHVSVPGSQRAPKRDAQRLRDVDPKSYIEVTLDLRHPELPEPSAGGERLSVQRLATQYGATPADADKVASVLRDYGLTIEEASLTTHSMRVSGTAEAIEKAFRPHLGMYESASQGEFQGREGDYSVPAELAGIVTGIHGLDERRVAHRRATAAGGKLKPLTPADLEQRYNFPNGDGGGQQIGIAEFGGGFFADDLTRYCNKFHRSVPAVTVVPVGLQSLTPNQIQSQDDSDAAGEVNMDVQIVAGLCPAAQIFVYFAPFTQKGWVDLLDKVISGNPGKPVTLSVSWGLAEDSSDWSTAARDAINDRLNAAALLGITVCVSSGDDGSGDQVNDGAAHVDFPSSSPFVLSVGGTMLVKKAGAVVEKTWREGKGIRPGGGATGGGTSIFHQRPTWQTAVTIKSINDGSTAFRVIPDVAALAGAPLYDLIFVGQDSPNGGTSASAPLWAALIARINALLPAAKRHRFLTPILYSDVGGKAVGFLSCRDIDQGNNVSSPFPGRGYSAGKGYDAVTGWGVPDGAKLLQQLSA